MKPTREVDHVVIRFAGDSGDGMQLTGGRFTRASVDAGNDIATLPNFPAEIRAPQGTLAGVSSFQLQFADHDIATPGDEVDVLVAMNPAALRANLPDVRGGGLIIADAGAFTPRNLEKVGYLPNPLEDESLGGYQVVGLPLTKLAVAACDGFGLGRKDAERTRNMYALGLLNWLYSRPMEPTEAYLANRFSERPELRDANIAALRAGNVYGEAAELFTVRYRVSPAPMPPGRYRQITGNTALAHGLITAAHLAGIKLFVGTYPITPASDILHELTRRKDQGVVCFQAEDEIAGIGAALGASFGGALGVSSTSGPGLALMQETINLAVMTELPLVVVDVQRAGPSTGMPTKAEQSDLNMALFGRPGESPVPVLAASSPSDCFASAVEAARIAIKYRTPVILLSDSYLGNGSEPWLVPQVADLEPIEPGFATGPNATDRAGKPAFEPYQRDPITKARLWAIPGTPGTEHRLGGLEKSNVTGAVSADPANHEKMVHLRADRIAGIVADIGDLEVDDPTDSAELLVLGWGSTWGPIRSAVDRLRARGWQVARAHLRHLNPLPENLGAVLAKYRCVVVPELNLGQLAGVLRSRYLVDVESFGRVRGLPLAVDVLVEHLGDRLAQLQEAK